MSPCSRVIAFIKLSKTLDIWPWPWGRYHWNSNLSETFCRCTCGINFTIPGDFLLELSYSQDFQKNLNSDFDQGDWDFNFLADAPVASIGNSYVASFSSFWIQKLGCPHRVHDHPGGVTAILHWPFTAKGYRKNTLASLTIPKDLKEHGWVKWMIDISLLTF